MVAWNSGDNYIRGEEYFTVKSTKSGLFASLVGKDRRTIDDKSLFNS
jgi:hypothetical protein